MLLDHQDKSPRTDSSAYVAPPATVGGAAAGGAGSRVPFGAAAAVRSGGEARA